MYYDILFLDMLVFNYLSFFAISLIEIKSQAAIFFFLVLSSELLYTQQSIKIFNNGKVSSLEL